MARKSMIESNVSSTSTSTTQHLIGMESTLTPTTGTIVAHTSYSSTTSTIQKQNISSEFNEENVSDDEDNLFRDEDNLSDNEEITDFPCDDTHQDEPQQNNTLSTGGNILDSSSHSTSNKSSDSVIDNPSDTSRIALKTPEPEKKSSPIIQKKLQTPDTNQNSNSPSMRLSLQNRSTTPKSAQSTPSKLPASTIKNKRKVINISKVNHNELHKSKKSKKNTPNIPSRQSIPRAVKINTTQKTKESNKQSTVISNRKQSSEKKSTVISTLKMSSATSTLSTTSHHKTKSNYNIFRDFTQLVTATNANKCYLIHATNCHCGRMKEYMKYLNIQNLRGFLVVQDNAKEKPNYAVSPRFPNMIKNSYHFATYCDILKVTNVDTLLLQEKLLFDSINPQNDPGFKFRMAECLLKNINNGFMIFYGKEKKNIVEFIDFAKQQQIKKVSLHHDHAQYLMPWKLANYEVTFERIKNNSENTVGDICKSSSRKLKNTIKYSIILDHHLVNFIKNYESANDCIIKTDDWIMVMVNVVISSEKECEFNLEIPGGKRRLGESTYQCAMRETEEETSISSEFYSSIEYNKHSKAIHHVNKYYMVSKK